MATETHPTPDVVPLFPLTGVLLLPGNYLPLNIFEPRYLRMVEDALPGSRSVGMVQPFVPMPDNRGPVAGAPERPDLYSVGCVGRIDDCERQADGRYLIVLLGVARFRIREELPGDRPYRRARVAYDEFLPDTEEAPAGLDPQRLLRAANLFAGQHEIEFDPDLLAALTPRALLHALCAALPFEPAEKQALLEAPTPAARESLLIELMGMGRSELAHGPRLAPPTIH